tara:strand:+ start:424 stop:843 length:420 start_codon:yes stop_codon:yes gene_type:complete
MRANISLNIDLDRVPQLVRGLLVSEGTRLVGLVQQFNDDITTPLDELEFEKVVENIKDLRETLDDINIVLAQAENITVGYINKDEPQEDQAEAEAAMAENLMSRMQDKEMKDKYDSFLDRINTENIYSDPEDQAGEESE